MQKPRWSEAIGLQHFFHKYADGSFEFVQGVVISHNGALYQKGRKKIEIEFGAGVGMIAIDPKQTDGAVPFRANFARWRSVSLYQLPQTSLTQGRLEIVERSTGSGKIGVGLRRLVMRIDTHYLAQIVRLRHGSDSNSGFAFEAADFQTYAAFRSRCGQHAKCAKLAIPDIAFHVARLLPGTGGNLFKIERKQV